MLQLHVLRRDLLLLPVPSLTREVMKGRVEVRVFAVEYVLFFLPVLLERGEPLVQ